MKNILDIPGIRGFYGPPDMSKEQEDVLVKLIKETLKKEPMNKEGLTWNEWRRVLGGLKEEELHKYTLKGTKEQKEAWENGEDPCEWLI